MFYSNQIFYRRSHSCGNIQTWGVKESGSIRNFNKRNHSGGKFHTRGVTVSDLFITNHCGNFHTKCVILTGFPGYHGNTQIQTHHIP